MEIMYDRIGELPQESNLWSYISVIERPNKTYEKEPSSLNPDPEVPLDITHSGLIRPLQPTENDDVDQLLRKIIGAGTDVEEILESRRAIPMSWKRFDSDPAPELKTSGFMAINICLWIL